MVHKVRPLKILLVLGTRPEAIKMAPVYRALKATQELEPLVCVTAQHREMLDKALTATEMKADYDLDLMTPNQDLLELASRCLGKLKAVLQKTSPDMVLVQGDTTTTLIAALSAFHFKIPIGHIEAGLRTDNKYSPFPEEMNRRLTSEMADLHFCPTELTQRNLMREGYPSNSVFLTGNTSIDALRWEWEQPHDFPWLEALFQDRKPILMTAHRRENFGAPLERVFKTVLQISNSFPEYQIIYPVHPNPNVQEPANRILGNQERISLVRPLEYRELVFALKKSFFVLTDSGGLQEEAPTAGRPTLVFRENTERSEALSTGFCHLVGTNPLLILDTFSELHHRKNTTQSVSFLGGPFGDGTAAVKITSAISNYFFGEKREVKYPRQESNL